MKILVLNSFFGKDFRPTATTVLKKGNLWRVFSREFREFYRTRSPQNSFGQMILQKVVFIKEASVSLLVFPVQ